MSNLLGRIPTWLGPAFKLQEPPVPNRLDTDLIVPQIDVAVGGWAYAAFSRVDYARPASTAGGRTTLLAADRELTYSILALEIDHSGGAAAAEVRVELYNSTSGTAVNFRRVSIPVGGSVSHVDIFGTADPVWIPAGFAFGFIWPATAAGEGFYAECMYASAPGGFRLR